VPVQPSPSPAAADPYAGSPDPLGAAVTTSGASLVQGTTGSAQIQALLDQLYGGDPFAAGVQPGDDRGFAAASGALSWLLSQGLDQQAAMNFVQNVVQALLDKGLDLTEVGANTLSATIAEMWQNPVIRDRFLLNPTASSVRAAIDTAIFGKRGKSLTTVLKQEDPGIYSLYRKYFGRNPTDAEVEEIKKHGDNEFQWEDYIRALPSHVPGSTIGQLFDARTGAKALYSKYYGRPPTEQEIEQLLAHGTDQGQWEDFIRTLPSHIPGLAIGPYNDLRGLADSVSNLIYGMPSNDSIVKSLYDQGLQNPDGVRYWYDQLPFQPGKHVTPVVFNAVYAAATSWAGDVWNQAPHPMDLHTIWQKGGVPGEIPATQAMQIANPAQAA